LGGSKLQYLPYILDTLIYIGIYSILSISLNIEAGYTKLMNFGKVAFFAIGSYTSALITLSGAPFIIGLMGAMFLTGVAGFLISIPTLRLREDYLAIVTITFGEILRIFLLSERWLTNGSLGLTGITRPLPNIFPENYSLFYTILVYVFLILSYLFVQRIVNSPFGRVLKAIREDEIAAKALGKNIFLFKTQSFIVGSILAGLSGALFAHYLTFIAPDMFLPDITFSIWIMMVIGGSSNNAGVILGAVLINIFERSTRFIKDFIDLPFNAGNFRLIIIGILLIVFITYRPEGILREKSMRVRGRRNS
jgi:ABC-type branched-subunit amino acid transport system permease subunit